MGTELHPFKFAVRAKTARGVAFYLVACALWIGYSHFFVRAFGPDYPVLYWVEANDRWAMVVVSAIALYLLASRIQWKGAVAQHALVESERAMSNLMGHLPGIAYRCENDAFRTVHFVSGGTLALTGHAPGDFRDGTRSGLSAVVHPDDAERVTRTIANALQWEQHYRVVYRVLTADGAAKWVMDSGSGVEEVDGHATLLEGLMVDITQQKEAQRQLQDQGEHLEEIVAARTKELTTEIEQRVQLEAQLREMTTRDALTGLYNRREMERFLAEEVDRCARYGRTLSVVMIDIDHFKRLNDTYGHQAGDEVLRWVADILAGGVRTTDRAVRYGGEEMALILPETSADSAFLVADRLRDKIHQDGAELTDEHGTTHRVEVTFSAGVSSFPHCGRDGDALIASADQALYNAKHEGRNQVQRARPKGPPAPPLRIAEHR